MIHRENLERKDRLLGMTTVIMMIMKRKRTAMRMITYICTAVYSLCINGLFQSYKWGSHSLE